ncbi:MAG: caspase family protein [Vicinamibacterales bacterium]
MIGTCSRRAAVLCLLVLMAMVAPSAQQPPARPAPAPGQAGRDLLFEADTTPAPVPRGYAVIVGVAHYEKLDASRQLQFPESDADAMYRVLISKEGGAFPPENVRLLKGRDATLANVRAAIEDWLPSVAQPADRVVVYFAGHGFVQQDKGYLAPWDVDPEHLAETAYPMDRLGEVLADKVRANWKVLLADACHSGKINAETSNESLEATFNRLPSRFLTLTATGGNEQSYEDPALATGFGLYTYFVVQAFRGYADNDPCDGRITADELVGFVRANVRRYARERQLSQTPTARGDYEPGMLLGVAKECLASGDTAPSMVGTAIVEANLDEVTVYVDGTRVGVVSKGATLTVPGLSAGLHEFVGERAGYEPDRQQVMIAPGQDVAVTLRVRYARRVRPQAADLNDQGERLLFSRRSSLSLLNLVPADRTQSEEDLRRAARLFERALAEDPAFARAAQRLGETWQLLGEFDRSVTAFRQALAIDATDGQVRTALAAVLIERGDADEAIRELVEVLRSAPADDQAHAMLARAYWDKAAWPQAIEQATLALASNRTNAQAMLWRADARRQRAASMPRGEPQRRLYAEARDDYRAFIDLTNFASGTASRLAFHFIGFGVGHRAHADRAVAWNGLRSAGFLGLCLTEQKVGNPLRARTYCQRALRHAPSDPIAWFLLGNINRDLFNLDASCDSLVSAQKSYEQMLRLNADIEEARNARAYLQQIAPIARTLECHG